MRDDRIVAAFAVKAKYLFQNLLFGKNLSPMLCKKCTDFILRFRERDFLIVDQHLLKRQVEANTAEHHFYGMFPMFPPQVCGDPRTKLPDSEGF